jgi:hypothetical protein
LSYQLLAFHPFLRFTEHCFHIHTLFLAKGAALKLTKLFFAKFIIAGYSNHGSIVGGIFKLRNVHLPALLLAGID